MSVLPAGKLLARVFLPFAAGYFLSYLYRVVNAVIAPDLIGDLGASPSSLGLLTSAYFIAFAATQLPLGVLLDRYGPRQVEAGLLLFASAGALLFASADSLAGLAAGRALIGFGVSACWMAALKAYTMWFPPERLPTINGFHLATGGLGALTAMAPVQGLLQITDWRGIFYGLALLTLISALGIFFLVPQKKTASRGDSLQMQLRGLRDVFTSRQFWRVTPLNMMTQATFLAVQGLWAGPWLQQAAQMDRPAAARLLSGVAAAMGAGFIGIGSTASWLSRRGIATGHTAVAGMIVFMLVQLAVLLSPGSWSWPLWLLYGFFGTSGVVSYSSLVQQFPLHLAGRVTTAVNLLVFVAAFVVQWALGVCIDFFSAADGGPSITGFQVGFSLLLGLQTACLLLYLLLRLPPSRQP